MIFKPCNTKLWDTFILPNNGTFYLFYLQCRNNYWDGYGLAISSDLLNWVDMGTVLDLGPGSGTGMVYHTGVQWILSFCKMPPGERHHIGFARSHDLVQWELLPEEYDLYPDAQWYDAAFPGRTSSRFGDLWVEPKQGGGFIGFLTASALDGPAGANGVIGMAESTDGLHWHALPPASRPCGIGWMEFASHVEMNSRHYALVGSNSGLGCRFDTVYNPTGKAGGMYVMASEQIEGPYEMVGGNAMLLGCRNAPPNWAYIPTYYMRAFRLGDRMLVNHHWLPREDFTDAWLGTCKELREERPGMLALYWWQGNDNLKGDRIFDISCNPELCLPMSYELPTGKWRCGVDGLSLETESTALVYSPTPCLETGVVVDAKLRFEGDGAGGLFFGNDKLDDKNPFDGEAFLINARGLAEFGTVKFGICGPVFMPENSVEWPVKNGEVMDIRLLVKGEFAEAYIDGKLVQCFGFSRPITSHIGLFAECGCVAAEALSAYWFSIAK